MFKCCKVEIKLPTVKTESKQRKTDIKQDLKVKLLEIEAILTLNDDL